MNVSGLQRFLAVVQAGSLNKAAERLHISQPALTKAIQGLEASLGVELFVRGARGVSLTSYGRAVLFRARLIDAEMHRLVEDVESLRDLAIGKLHFGAPPGPGFHTDILPAATQRLIAGGRKLSVNISMGTREQLLPMLRQGGLDFLIAVIEEDESTGDLFQEPLLEDRNAIVVSQTHPLLGRRPLGLADLADFPWFVMSESAALERALLAEARAQGCLPSHSVIHSDSSQLVKSAILTGNGIGFARYQVVRKDLLAGVLQELTLEASGALVKGMGRHTMGLIHRRGAELPAACLQLIDEIRAGCRAHAPLTPLEPG